MLVVSQWVSEPKFEHRFVWGGKCTKHSKSLVYLPPNTGRVGWTSLMDSAPGALCMWTNSAFKMPRGLSRLLFVGSWAACQLSAEAALSLDYYKWKTWLSVPLFFFLPLFIIIRKSCFSFRIRQLLFSWLKTSRKQTEPHFYINLWGEDWEMAWLPRASRPLF